MTIVLKYGARRGGDDVVQNLQAALDCRAYTSGTTHDFYHYPARFSPRIARDVVARFSTKGDWVLDPFMGGGTAVIESLLLGRRIIGVDINALARFITHVRTRPLSVADEDALRRWASTAARHLAKTPPPWLEPERIRNLPPAVSRSGSRSGSWPGSH